MVVVQMFSEIDWTSDSTTKMVALCMHDNKAKRYGYQLILLNNWDKTDCIIGRAATDDRRIMLSEPLKLICREHALSEFEKLNVSYNYHEQVQVFALFVKIEKLLKIAIKLNNGSTVHSETCTCQKCKHKLKLSCDCEHCVLDFIKTYN